MKGIIKSMFYTLKDFLKQNDEMIKNNASDKALYKMRSVWKIASDNYLLKKVSYKRLEKAKKIYNSLMKMWKYKDLNLEYDSYCTPYGEKRSNYYSKLEDEKAEQIKPLLKELNITLDFSTFAHLRDSRGEEII